MDLSQFRAEDVSQDMYNSIDLAVDKIRTSNCKNKTKIEKKIVLNGAGKLFTDAVVEEAATTESCLRSKTIDLELNGFRDGKRSKMDDSTRLFIYR